MNSTKRVIFNGRVQGVGFRYTAKQLALGFDLVGSVRNQKDGTVELKVMGEENEVNDFITEIVDESELAGLIKEHRIWDIDPLTDCRGFTITS
ncbi:acylphosphatase [bacterium]|jgi:acylphosphatase|nr:acylphosphatase [bacterium]MDB4572787.1 acylphosphatase [Akkermansiaceae bacterium]MDF1714106.1 acylphosphatase [Akkermansiaceae bacterium]